MNTYDQIAQLEGVDMVCIGRRLTVTMTEPADIHTVRPALVALGFDVHQITGYLLHLVPAVQPLEMIRDVCPDCGGELQPRLHKATGSRVHPLGPLEMEAGHAG